MWGYDQDPSGFKRWAIDRPGAFQDLVERVEDPDQVDAAFYATLGAQVAQATAVMAGAMTAELHSTRPFVARSARSNPRGCVGTPV